MKNVSCLMVTSNRSEQLVRSFHCYCTQDYLWKELVIVTNGDDDYNQQVQRQVEASGRSDVVVVAVRSHVPLGALRNIALDHAVGPLICIWDDDDLNHPSRLRRQIEGLEAGHAQVSLLADHLHLFWDTGQLFWCNWIRTRSFKGMPATLLAYKDALPRYNEELDRNEDTQLLFDIYRGPATVAAVGSLGHLFIYTFHGSNVFSRTHHLGLVSTTGFEFDTLSERRRLLCRALGQYPLNIALSVSDYLQEQVFTWRREDAISNDTTDVDEPAPRIYLIRRKGDSQSQAPSLDLSPAVELATKQQI